MTISARVYQASSPSTLIAGLPHSRDRRWLHQLNETGSGELAVHVDDEIFATQPAILGYGNIVRFAIDGTDRFAFILEQRNVDPAPVGEKGARYKRVSGRGVLALLEDAVVYPEASYVGSYARQRAFDYTAIAYDDSAWTAPVQVQRQGARTGVAVTRWIGYPKNWYYFADTFWIWAAGYPAPLGQPVGTNYFRKQFTLASAADVIVAATCDNEFRLWLDGEALLEGDDWQQTYSDTRTLDSGTHQLAVEATNVALSSGAPSPAGFLCAVRDAETNVAYVKSNSTWKCLGYPATVPGMSLGKILDLLLDEAQARNVLSGITWTFTNTLDSEGNTWADNPDIVFDIGTNYLDVIRTLVEQYVDVEMTPTLVLNIYNKGALGSNLTGSVDLRVGTHFEEATGTGEDHLTNVVLARDTTGLLTQETDPSSLANRKRREIYLETALAPSEARAQAISEEVLDEFAQPSFQLSAKVIESSGPYTSWRPGDTILMPNPAGVAQAATVLSLAVEEDEAGHEIFNTEAVMLDATS